MPAIRTAKNSACDVFEPSAEAVTVHRRDFWDALDLCIRVVVRAKAVALRVFDSFLALVMR